MSAGKQIVEQLQKHQNQPAPVEVSAPGKRTTIRVRADKVEQIGARLNEIEATGAPLPPGGAREWAKDFADRARYLLEPLEVVEVDEGANEAIARSYPPETSPDEIEYYEARVSGSGKATFRRYRFDRQHRHRSPAPIDLSHEQIRRLVDDLDESNPNR